MSAGLFLEERLDPMVTQGCRSTVQFNRTKVYVKGGRLTQRFNWTNPKHQMDLAYRARPKLDYDKLLDFFYVVLANGYIGFRVKDWSNYQLTQENSSLSYITGSAWQIQRAHTVGGARYLRNVTKPVVDTINVFRTRGVSTTIVAAGIDHTTGIATISGDVAGDTYTAEGEFDIPMTFVDDAWVSNLEATAADLWLSPQPIMLEEILL